MIKNIEKQSDNTLVIDGKIEMQKGSGQGDRMLLERMDFVVKRIDGDYAYLQKEESGEQEEERCVARALLPPEIFEGCGVIYEMLEYRMK